MNRNSAIICSAVLLVGMSSGFIGGLWFAAKQNPPAEPTPALISETGWEFTSGFDSGPALVAGPNPLTLDSVSAEPDGPDAAWFPEAISETAGGKNSELPPGELTVIAQPVPFGQLTPEQQRIWKDQLKRLPPGEAEQLLQIRQSLGAEFPKEYTSRPEDEPGRIKPGQIKPLSATEPGDVPPRNSVAAEPGRIELPAREAIRSALPAGPLLPSDIDLASASRGRTESASPILKQAVQAARLNRANAATIGYRRREVIVLQTGIPIESKSGNLERDVNSLVPVSGETSIQEKGSRHVPTIIGQPEPWLARLDLRHGEVVATKNPFDVAITGSGWFRIRHDGGDFFTRCGLLAIDKQNRLAVRTGAGLVPLQPVIVLPEDLMRIEIANDGRVFARQLQKSESKGCGQIELVSFRDAGQLAWSAKGFYKATASSGKPFPLEAPRVAIRQGHLEQSNVDLKREAELLDRVRTVISADANQ
jgi:flagellar basal body rod protein FlgG